MAFHIYLVKTDYSRVEDAKWNKDYIFCSCILQINILHVGPEWLLKLFDTKNSYSILRTFRMKLHRSHAFVKQRGLWVTVRAVHMEF